MPNFLSVCIISSISNPFKKAFNVISNAVHLREQALFVIRLIKSVRNWLKKEMSDVCKEQNEDSNELSFPLENLSKLNTTAEED